MTAAWKRLAAPLGPHLLPTERGQIADVNIVEPLIRAAIAATEDAHALLVAEEGSVAKPHRRRVAAGDGIPALPLCPALPPLSCAVSSILCKSLSSVLASVENIIVSSA